MRNGIILASLFAASSATFADDSNGTCNQIHDIATSVMSARQRGVPVKEAMDIMGGTNIGKNIVLTAYREDRWATDSMQERTVTEFANTYYIECVEAFSKE